MTALLETPVQLPAVPAHGEPPQLTGVELAFTHAETLATPRRRYSLAAKLLFVVMDVLYGGRGSYGKYRVLEIVARIPYQTWETATYKQVSRHPGRAGRLWQRVLEFRGQQDNETWHLMIMTELAESAGEKQGVVRGRVLPRLICLGYWHFSWLLYALKPDWSHRLNADFEDHAEHTYAEFVAAHPELEHLPHHSSFARRYGASGSVADLLRQIGHDERMHKLESERYLAAEPLR